MFNNVVHAVSIVIERGGFMFIKKTTEIPISMIKANAQQPRKAFGEEQLLELKKAGIC